MASTPELPALPAADVDDSAPLGRSMPADLAEQLRGRIHAGLLGPGDRLPNERELAATLGVGRITVREAIRLLVADGYLVSKRGNSGGTYVSDLQEPELAWLRRVQHEPDWIVDLIEYRKAVEARAAELAAGRRTAEHLAELRAAIDEGADPRSRRAFRHADHRFHVALAQASGSPRLLQAVVAARGEMFAPTDRLSFHDHYAQTFDEHGAILAAVEAADAAGARAAMEQHLEAALQDFLDMVVGRAAAE